MSKIALIIGPTGGVGSATATALLTHGWQIRALHRDPATAARKVPGLSDVAWIKGDAMHRETVIRAGSGAKLIVHGANPPGYRNWRSLAIPMLANTIAAAEAADARLVFPGNVYNFDPDAPTPISELAPQKPCTRKGAVRVEMEQMLADAADRGTRVLIVRACDYFGPNAPGSWFQNALAKPGRPVRSITYPGRHDIGHAWAYLPDLAETIARLAGREPYLGRFEVFHFGGHFLERGIEMAHAIMRAARRPDASIKPLPWRLAYLAAPFVTTFREVIEMRYLWQTPLQLDNAKLVKFLGDEPRTPFDDAVRETLGALGCLCDTNRQCVLAEA
jgi:nucleoside-diphosphate-sugar epimerase